MIVIATNNGNNYLSRLLDSIDKYGNYNHKICIVDTGSTNIDFIAYINSLDKNKYIVTRSEYKGYDTGAYIHAYFNFYDTEYIFLHDSLEVIDKDWIKYFTIDDADVCYYSTFDMRFDSDIQKQRIIDIGIYNESCRYGVFGPFFYIKRSIMDSINSKFGLFNIIPNNKLHQMGMERGWAMAISYVTSNIKSIAGNYPNILNKFTPVRD